MAEEIWNWKPHPAQERFFCSAAQVRAAACGRRWGKTESLSVDIASMALDAAHVREDCRQLVVAPTDTQARLIGGEVLTKLLDAWDQGTPWTRGLRLDVRQRPCLQITIAPADTDTAKITNDKKAKGKGPSVVRIIFRTAGRDGRSLRGLWAHRIVCDEAAYIPDRVLTEVLLPMLADVGGDLVLASSPAGKRSAYYRLFAKGQTLNGPNGELRPDEHGILYASFQCPSTDNPHIDQAFLSAILQELGELTYRAEILAEFIDDWGSVFREDDITGCLADDPRTTLADGWIVSKPVPGHHYAVGVDWGRKADFSVCCVLDCTARPARLVGLWRWQGTAWETQVSLVAQIVADFQSVKVLCDGNSIGDPLAERLQIATREAVAPDHHPDKRVPMIERFIFAPDSKLQLIDRLNLALSSRAVSYPAHGGLLTELRGFEYGAVSSNGRAKMAARGQGHDDIVCSLALAWWCAPDAAPEPPSSSILLGSSLHNGSKRCIL